MGPRRDSMLVRPASELPMRARSFFYVSLRIRQARAFFLVCVGLLHLIAVGGCSDDSPTRPWFPAYVFIQAWGTHGSGNGQFDYPEGVALDDSGNVYVADSWNKWATGDNGSGQATSPYASCSTASGGSPLARANTTPRRRHHTRRRVAYAPA